MGKKLPLKPGLCIALTIAAVAVAGPVFAADTIEVKFGSYGYAAERKVVTDDIKKACDGKPACTVMVKNDSFAGGVDPSPGNDKGLMIGWKCGATDHKEQFAEGRAAKIGCD